MSSQEDTLRALYWLYQLFNNTLDRSLFRNGVTDSTGTVDEGEVRCGEILAEAARILDDCGWLTYRDDLQPYPEGTDP